MKLIHLEAICIFCEYRTDNRYEKTEVKSCLKWRKAGVIALG